MDRVRVCLNVIPNSLITGDHTISTGGVTLFLEQPVDEPAELRVVRRCRGREICHVVNRITVELTILPIPKERFRVRGRA